MKSNKQEIIRPSKKKWLNLLEEAVNEGVKIKLNHKFTYKGKNLGTFLVDSKMRGNKALKEAIKERGVDFTYHSKEFQNVIKKFIRDLWEDKNPNRHKYYNRFNRVILPKRDKMKKSDIKEINAIWKIRFNEDRSWEFPKTLEERIEAWKEFRYNKELNPDKKWFRPLSKMGNDLYFWVYSRKKKPHLMEKTWHLFRGKELKELKKEGFHTPVK